LRRQFVQDAIEGANGYFSSVEDAIAFKPQIAVVANPASLHISVAQSLAEQGVHLLVEKPLSSSLKGVTELIKTCQTAGAVLSVGYNLRFLPSLQRFRELLNEGRVGEILSVRCEVGAYLPLWRAKSDYRQTVSAKSELGGGVLLELSHELDYLRWIFGEVDWVRATLSRQSRLEIDVEDFAHLILGFTPEVNGRQLIGSLNLDFFRHDSTRTCVAIGDKGSLRWNGLTGEVAFFESGHTTWQEVMTCKNQPDDSYLAEWNNFISSALTGKAPLITGLDGIEVLKIIQAAKQSDLEDGRTIGVKSNVKTELWE
jgi:predicted dehydrogenase